MIFEKRKIYCDITLNHIFILCKISLLIWLIISTKTYWDENILLATRFFFVLHIIESFILIFLYVFDNFDFFSNFEILDFDIIKYIKIFYSFRITWMNIYLFFKDDYSNKAHVILFVYTFLNNLYISVIFLIFFSKKSPHKNSETNKFI